MPSWPPSWVCFYCTNPINKGGHFIEATLRTHYARGGSRDAVRRFHEPCFANFEIYGRPWNPGTDFELLAGTVFRADEALSTLDPDRLRPASAPYRARPHRDAVHDRR